MKISSSRFNFDPDKKCFSALTSAMQDLKPEPLGNGKVGFTMVSSKTGREVIFQLVQTNRIEDDDDAPITHWTYKPTPQSAHDNPHLGLYRVEILNDVV